MTKKSAPSKKPAPKPAAKAPKPDPKKSKPAPAKAPAKSTAAKPAAPAKTAAPKAPAPAKAAPKAPSAKAPAAKPSVKAPAPKAEPAKPVPAQKAAAAPPPATGRKGITIVTPKPQKKPSPPKLVSRNNSPGGNLLGPGSPIRRPLIPSGPTATKPISYGDGADLSGKKSPFAKKDLARFRALLLAKRSELIGDVKNMEQEALRSNAGSLSNLPQHMADQGSDAYDQALALDLAAVDRRLIKEIDDALKRIESGTYGLCELTGKPIKLERLEEIPWARHSIEAAREMERRIPRP